MNRQAASDISAPITRAPIAKTASLIQSTALLTISSAPISEGEGIICLVHAWCRSPKRDARSRFVAHQHSFYIALRIGHQSGSLLILIKVAMPPSPDLVPPFGESHWLVLALDAAPDGSGILKRGVPSEVPMNAHQTALTLFAVALGVVIAIASVTTVERVHMHKASNDAMPETIGLAKPHAQLDCAPSEPLED
jgi:hypothetical protein